MPAIYISGQGQTAVRQIRDHRRRPHAKTGRSLSRLPGRGNQELCLRHGFGSRNRAVRQRGVGVRREPHFTHFAGDLTEPDTYARLHETLEKVAELHQTGGNAIFYLAVASQLFGTIVEQLGAAGLPREEAGSFPPRHH